MKALDKKVIDKHAAKAMKKAAKKIKAKESSDDTDSTSDEERHEAYKSKEKKSKHALRVYHPHLVIPHSMLTRGAMLKPKQTVESLIKAGEQTAKQQKEMEEKGKELADEVKKMREDFEKKDKDAKEAMVEAHASQDKASDAKNLLKRQLARLENTRHEAVHEGSRSATEGVANGKRDVSELKIQAKEEARKAAAAAGASATQAIDAAKAASKSLATVSSKSAVEKDVKTLFAEQMDKEALKDAAEASDSDEELVQTSIQIKKIEVAPPSANEHSNKNDSANATTLATKAVKK